MTDPSTPVPSDEAKTAAARILAREYGYDHVWENDVGEEVYDRHYWDHIGKVALTAAYAVDAPRLRAEAAAEARARCDEWDLAYANLELRVARAAAEARADYDDFIEGLTAKLNAAGVPAMPSWPDAIDWLIERAQSAQAEARAATLREAAKANGAIVQELRMAVTALGWVKTAFRKIEEGTECTPAHCRAADAQRAHERGMAALRHYDALTGRCCGGDRAPCSTHFNPEANA